MRCDWPPCLAYFDTTRNCVECGCSFVFSKDEQQFWYEELGFRVQSRAIRCLECRARKRRKIRAERELDDALSALDPNDALQLAGIARPYLAAGHRQKAAEYLRRARNRAKTPRQTAEYVRQLEKDTRNEIDSDGDNL